MECVERSAKTTMTHSGTQLLLTSPRSPDLRISHISSTCTLSGRKWWCLPPFDLGDLTSFVGSSPGIPSGSGWLSRVQLCCTLREARPRIYRTSSSSRPTDDEDRNGAEGGTGRRPNQNRDKGNSHVCCTTRPDSEAFRQRIIRVLCHREDREARFPPTIVLGKA